MIQAFKYFQLSASAIAACLVVSACGGGAAEAPPTTGATNSTQVAADTTPPTVTITGGNAASTATGPVTFTFTFSEDVGASFTLADIVATGGTMGTLSKVDATHYTVVMTPTANSNGTMIVTVVAQKFTDLAGNSNTAAASAQQVYATAAKTQMTLPVSFDSLSIDYGLIGFGGAEDSSFVPDPTNAANSVAKVVRAAASETYAGTTITAAAGLGFAPKVPFNANDTRISVRVWSPDAGIPVRLKVEDHADPTKSVETDAMTTVAGGWQTLTFSFLNQAAGTAALNFASNYDKATIFFDFGRAKSSVAQKTYYFDDITFVTGAVVPPVAAATISFDEATAPLLIGFGGAEDSTVVADPTNAANKVAKVVKANASQVWAGTTISNLANNAIARIGFSATNTTMTARVWSPDAGIPVRLKVENATDGTQSVETEAVTTVANAWQTLTFNFASPAAGTAALNLATVYNKASIFFNFGTVGTGKTYYLDDLNYTVGSTPAPVASSLPITFEEIPAPALVGFGGAEDSTVVVDPTNGANKVAKVVKSAVAELWAGTTVSTGANNSIAIIPFTAAAKTMTVRVWSPTAGIPVRLKVEDAADPTRSCETEATTTVASGWQTMTFNFANQAAGTAALNTAFTFNKVSIFFNFGTTGANGGGGTFYFDNVSFIP
jgi:Bacterial Ig-like domain